MSRRPAAAACAAALGLLAAAPVTAPAQPPAPFGHACSARYGVRFCPTTGLADRVASFDGTPLDVDVTLPARGDGPFPTLVMLHGYGNDKRDFEAIGAGTNAAGGTRYRYDNVHFARAGYAVVNYSARGFGRSCGKDDPPTAGCERGWLHLADQRFEVRDTQHLLGLLVDAGIAQRRALGVTGISYGGGQALQLAFLRNRVRLPNGDLARWLSPAGRALRISAVWARWGWTDLGRALVPNGRLWDTRIATPRESREPVGVPIQSYVAGLYAISGTLAPKGLDGSADLSAWKERMDLGEPFGADTGAIVRELSTFHSAAGLVSARRGLRRAAAPLLIENGWTDDLFPASEALAAYTAARAFDQGNAPALALADLGHARGTNRPSVDRALNVQGERFLARHLLGAAGGPRPGSVRAYLQSCPRTAPPGSPVAAASWEALHPGALRFGGGAPQRVESAGGNARTGRSLDPVGGGGDACKAIPRERATGTAVYETRSPGVTLLGAPVVRARVRARGDEGQLAARLWEVRGSSRRLVTRGVYRLEDDQAGIVSFQLHPAGWRFQPGTTIRLELLGRDAPYYRPGNGEFSVRVGEVRIELPVRERPGDVAGVVEPALAPYQTRAGVTSVRLKPSPLKSRGLSVTRASA